MRYESEILYDLMKRDGLLNPSQDNLPYESELKEEYIDGVKGAYPKLTDYQAEWLNYAYNEKPIGEFPYVALSDVTNATIENVVPYAYKSAILKGNTKEITGKNIYTGIDEDGFISSSGFQSTIGPKTTEWLPCEPNTTYVCNSPSRNRWLLKSSTGVETFIGGSTGNETPTVTTLSDTAYLRCYYKHDGYNGEINLQIEKGNVSTDYEPYWKKLESVKMPVLTTSNEDGTKANILSCHEEVVLRGIGDVKDTLDCLTGEVTERIGEAVLDGDENWQFQGEKTNTIVFTLLVDKLKNTAPHIISDRFPTNADGDVEKITNAGNGVYVAILKTKADNLKDFKSYLSQNPITIQYQLAKESIKTVDLTITNQNGESLSKMTPIEGTMNLTTSGTIAPTFSGEIPVEAIEQNLESFVHLEGVKENE